MPSFYYFRKGLVARTESFPAGTVFVSFSGFYGRPQVVKRASFGRTSLSLLEQLRTCLGLEAANLPERKCRRWDLWWG
jgi:hypothetical protein